MQLLAVCLLVALVFTVAVLMVHWEDRRVERRKAARVHAALVRIGEHPGR
ncbi:MAG: hypothetical protein ACRDQ7_26355 [Haloechinothrix sp.]